MKRWIIVIAIAAVIAMSITGVIVARPLGGDVAVDTTGSTGGKVDASTTPVGSATPVASPSPTSTPEGTPAATTGPGVIATVSVGGPGGPVTVRGPLMLLNPSTVRPGSTVGITGSGFDPVTVIDFYLVGASVPQGTPQAGQPEPQSAQPSAFVQTDKGGTFGGVNITLTKQFGAGPFAIEARQRKGDKTARATGVVTLGTPQVQLGTNAGKPGDNVEINAQGFVPNEELKMYWNSLGGVPITTFTADDFGNLNKVAIRVPFGAVGNNAFIFMGDKSQSPVTMPFLQLALFPSVELSSYAIKADNVLAFTGKDFGPFERVLIYLNTPDGSPITAINSDGAGGFANTGGFIVPFELTGQQTLIFIGEQSRAPSTASFDVLPYTPSVQPSTYGGRPGTRVTFYGNGFARQEIAHVFLGRSKDDPGREVSCFLTDLQGNAASKGEYVIPGNARQGNLVFTVLGAKSRATASTSVEVLATEGPVDVPDEGPFTCGLDRPAPPPQEQPPQPGSGDQNQPAAPGSTQPEATAPESQPGVPSDNPSEASPTPEASGAAPPAEPEPSPVPQATEASSPPNGGEPAPPAPDLPAPTTVPTSGSEPQTS